jgi:hypothetical protein
MVMMAPRKPTADCRQREGRSRHQAYDCRLQFGKALLRIRPQRRDDNAHGRNHDRDHLEPGQMIAEKDKTEDRGLDRLGLQVGRGYHEGAIIHRQQHQPGGDDLRERTQHQPRPECRGRPRHGVAGRHDHHAEENQRERKTEQEADVGRTPGSERPGQAALHRIAHHLPKRGGDGEGDPERDGAEHREFG